jgi:hypothetical protein
MGSRAVFSWTWSDEVLVLFRPSTAYAALSTAPGPSTAVGLLARPLRLAFAIGAAVSFVNGGHLGPARLLPAMLCWTFVPALRVGAFVVVATLLARRPLRRTHHLHLHGAGYGPWYVCLLAISLLHLLRPAWPSGVTDPVLALGLAGGVLWSLPVRFAFWHVALGLTRQKATLALALTTVLFWSAVAAFFFATDQLLPRLMGRM